MFKIKQNTHKTKQEKNILSHSNGQVWKKIRVWSTLKEIPRPKGLSPILLLAGCAHDRQIIPQQILYTVVVAKNISPLSIFSLLGIVSYSKLFDGMSNYKSVWDRRTPGLLCPLRLVFEWGHLSISCFQDSRTHQLLHTHISRWWTPFVSSCCSLAF